MSETAFDPAALLNILSIVVILFAAILALVRWLLRRLDVRIRDQLKPVHEQLQPNNGRSVHDYAAAAAGKSEELLRRLEQIDARDAALIAQVADRLDRHLVEDHD